MKVVISIVTYRNEEHINRNLETLFRSDVVNEDCKVEIINNHSNFKLHDEFKDRVTVLHNVVRPDWSCGHITRDYNSAYIRNFVSLAHPAVDWIVTSQDDVLWKPNWWSQLMRVNRERGFEFVTSGIGDSIVAVTAEAIRHTGIWDERFCAIGWHDGDMFSRAIIWFRAKSSINDWGHGRACNNCDEGRMGTEHKDFRYDSIFITQPSRNADQYDAIDCREPKKLGFSSADWQIPIFTEKWGPPEVTTWGVMMPHPPARPRGNSYTFYPYFEKDVYNLKEKGYIVP